MTDSRRALPSVSALLAEPAVAQALARVPRALATEAVRNAVDSIRKSNNPMPRGGAGWAELVAVALEALESETFKEVFNATGVVIHTNLGRAPLARRAAEAAVAVATGYSNLEYELMAGTRGSRQTHCVGLLRELTGAEDALVVNNCAAALVLVLAALATGKDVVVSRGELIEIGDSFRIPDILRESGARLVEVGATNRTHAQDYVSAAGADTRVLLKVHRSNFRVDGFASDVPLRELVDIGRSRGLRTVFDFGSGLMLHLGAYLKSGGEEPTARDAVRSGADAVVMSGDKLLGGPQAGIILGRSETIGALRRHPLVRALRVDKLTLASLQATLELYREDAIALAEIPVLRMIAEPEEQVKLRAERVAAELEARGVTGTVVPCEGSVGGGAYPTAVIASWGVALEGDARYLEARARAADIPIVGRVNHDRYMLDMRTVEQPDERRFVEVLARAIRPAS